MTKNLRDMYKKIMEASVLPNPANLKKPGIGPGSGQHTVGNQSVRSKPLAQAVSDTSSFKSQSELNRPKLNTAPAAQVPTNNVATPLMDKAVAAKTAATNAARIGVIRRPAPAPAKPANAADNVKDNRPANNTQLTAQAIARKGFGAPAGGNYKAAQTPVAPALDPNRNKALDQPSTQSNMALAQNPGSGGVGSSLGKQSGSGTTVTQPNTAQAATPPTTPPAQTQSWSKKVGQAMRDHVKKGGKAGDVIKVDGKSIKVAWKDKSYQKRLAKKTVKESLEENRVVKKTGKMILAHPAMRQGKGQQSSSNGRRYRVRVKPLVTEDGKMKGKKVVVNFDPETSTSWN